MVNLARCEIQLQGRSQLQFNCCVTSQLHSSCASHFFREASGEASREVSREAPRAASGDSGGPQGGHRRGLKEASGGGRLGIPQWTPPESVLFIRKTEFVSRKRFQNGTFSQLLEKQSSVRKSGFQHDRNTSKTNTDVQRKPRPDRRPHHL